MDIGLRARPPLIATLVAVALLAVLTGASNQVADGGNGRDRLAVGSSPVEDLFAFTAPTAPVTTTTSAAPDPTATEVGADGQVATAGDGASSGNDGPASAGDPETLQEQEEVAAEPAPARTRPTAPPPSQQVVAAPPAPAAHTRLPAVEAEVLTLTNVDRGANGVAPVNRDGCLDAEASAWAGSMAQSATMAHSAGAGGAVQGCRGGDAYWGDNIGYWQPCSASAMQTWWMDSPSHRPHILDANFTVVGIGVWAEPGGRCWFQVYFGS